MSVLLVSSNRWWCSRRRVHTPMSNAIQNIWSQHTANCVKSLWNRQNVLWRTRMITINNTLADVLCKIFGREKNQNYFRVSDEFGVDRTCCQYFFRFLSKLFRLLCIAINVGDLKWERREKELKMRTKTTKLFHVSHYYTLHTHSFIFDIEFHLIRHNYCSFQKMFYVLWWAIRWMWEFDFNRRTHWQQQRNWLTCWLYDSRKSKRQKKNIFFSRILIQTEWLVPFHLIIVYFCLSFR